MRFEAKEEEEEIHSAPTLVKEAKPVAANNEVIKEAVPVVQEAKEEMVKEEVEMEGEQEERRRKETGRRRRKKHGSEDPEEGAGGHRVVICDDQVAFRANSVLVVHFLTPYRLPERHMLHTQWNLLSKYHSSCSSQHSED